MIDLATFRAQVRHALEHLYDVDALAEHWLLHPLGLTQRPDRARLLRQQLIEAIQRLRPPSDEPVTSPNWQIYHVLVRRYQHQTSANVLADQLAMSSRHLRRLQRNAIARLSEQLLRQLPSPTLATPAEEHPVTEQLQVVDNELDWLRTVSLSEPVDVGVALGDVLHTVGPLVQKLTVQIVNHLPHDLPAVAIHPLALNQVLLSILTYALHDANGGRVSLSTLVLLHQLTVQVESDPGEPTTVSAQQPPQLVVAQRILSIFGGQLEQTGANGQPLRVCVTLPIAGATRVLVIDDNPDALQLYERFVTGTRYTLAVCQEPQRAIELAIQQVPQILVIDIMMPGMDGWRLLGQLRHHPVTAPIPIVVSTIVSEKVLALSLGAVDFIQKPVSRRIFLTALDQVWRATGPDSH